MKISHAANVKVSFALVALVLLPSVAAAQATTNTTVTHMPFLATISSSCQEQTVDVDGQLTLVEHTTLTRRGHRSISSHLTIEGTGTSLTTGDRFIFHQASNDVFNTHLPPEAANEQTQEETIHFIATGQTEDLRIHVLFHTTVTPNGDVVVVVNNSERTCR
jgi:hypothetical protein